MYTWAAGIAEKLQDYVYRLVDPRDNMTFYVGKGTGDRVFQHVREPASMDLDDETEDLASLKVERIKDIQASGGEVRIIIHRHGLSSETALEVEAALIDAFPELTNVQGGHGSRARGTMTPEEIVKIYGLPELTDCENYKLLLINVNRIAEDRGVERVYDQTRFCWRLNVERAQKADYVVAVERGVTLDVFEVDEWKVATQQNFPEFGLDMPTRWAFVGRRAPREVIEHIIGEHGKRVTNEGMRHIQNPVRYWNL